MGINFKLINFKFQLSYLENFDGIPKHLFENISFRIACCISVLRMTFIFTDLLKYVNIAVMLNTCTNEVSKDPCQDKIPVQL